MKKVLPIIFLVIILALSLCACSEAYKLSFTSDSIRVSIGTSFVPDMVIRPKNAEYALTVENSTIASVSDNVVTTKKEGVTKLTATSGDKEAVCTLYVVDEEVVNPSYIKVLPTYSIKLCISNYEDAGLQTGEIESVYAYEGSYLNVNLPFIKGYYVSGWYTDKACTVQYDMNTAVTSSFTLYAYLTEMDTDYNVANHLVVGLLYPNLKHEELILPEGTESDPIYGIADEAFMGDEEIKKVTIPASYQTIGTSAFAGCKNLEEVVIPTDSALSIVGTNAFGVLRDKYNKITDGCEKLSLLNLPDTVTKVGAFAFYNCAQLAFDGIPEGLNIIEQYAFAGTKINNVSLKNINSIYEGAFYNCAQLDTVTDTEDVGVCKKLAFAGTKLITVAKTKYNGSRNDDDAIYYAGTILFGCYENYGKLFGSGKLHIKDSTTLIADNSFYKDKDDYHSELTIYIDTEIASGSVESGKSYSFLGENVFGDSTGVFIVVEEGKANAFREYYGEDNENSNYAERIVEEEIVTVAGNSDTVNYGQHVLLRKTDPDGTSYFYDRFIEGEGGTRIVRVDELPVSYSIIRINMSAFNSLANLEILGLGNVHSIAYYAVNNCPNLTKIELDKTVSPAVLEHRLSIRFEDMPTLYVYVADLSSYQSVWSSNVTAYNRLRQYVG